MLKTTEYATAIGETYDSVRNAYGRPGREPREAGPRGGETDWAKGSHRRFVAADALAWRITRDLADLGLTWEQAAKLVRREAPADRALNQDFTPDTFFAVWAIGTATAPEGAAWYGTLAEIADVIASDLRTYGPVGSVRMVSLDQSIETATAIARKGGYAFVGGEIVPLESDAS